ncbi:putative glycosyltransferase MJ1607 [Planktothrix tepida]|uniref:Glycosyltransferase MJ1607 n=2 Tax=Planktothrix TaxID=54304 RepID=A0A9W4GBX2_9CYAN|nr:MULTISPECIES: glycosyltransferase family 4 protein [Planktothrix]CAD5916916.1 putative glycosyltransferase MJ1607 [Planktothrix tepida]CAD5985385.1 putative glycosyltransferase MJ1607 [Planktothrix pseudagardhii]CUR30696.1 putative Glycosyl transferase, group 1 family protein [Planktothrix tepida PCC 9214]
MKIGYLIPEWPGQSHVWAWREISHLRELGLDITIFSTRQPKELGKHSFALAAQAETCYLWPLSISKIILSLTWAIVRHLKGFLSCIQLAFTLPVDKQPSWKSVLPLIIPACQLAQEVKYRQIKHLHTPIPGNSAILCMMVKRLVDLPFSLTVVAAFEDWGGALKEKFEDAAFVTLVAEWMVEEMQKDFSSLAPQHYHYITRHGVDTQKWMPDSNKKLDVACPKRILSIGRLVFSKGFDILIKAVAIVKEKGVPFQLRIAGSGPEQPRLQALIYELGLNEDVLLLGSIGEEECLSEAQSADLFILASHKEPLGVVYLEAMAAEVATIGTAAGGVVEIITDHVNGLLVPPFDVQKLADAIVQLLTDDLFRKQLAKAGRQTVIEKFDSRLGAATLHNLILQSSYARPGKGIE